MASSIFTDTLQKTTSGYKVVISYLIFDDELGNTVRRYAELDLLNGGVEVTSNADLTSFPTMMGFNISDHIYRQPIEISLKGKFGQNGLKAFGWTGTDRLTKIQEEFESIQRAGVKCNITIIRGDTNTTSDEDIRFIERKNMVLTSIHWTEQQNVMDFSFNFKEAISGSYMLSTIIKDESDPNLPEITDLQAASLVGELISSDEVIKMTVDVLRSLNIVNDKTFNTICATGTIVTGALKLTSAAAILIAVAATSGTVPVVGWIVGIGCAIAAGVCAIVTAVEAGKRAAQIARYNELGHVFTIEDDMSEDEKQRRIANFVKFLEEVKTNVDNMLSDIVIYRIANADRQECMLTVNGNYYVQCIEKNNADGIGDDKTVSFRIKSLYLGTDERASKAKLVGLDSFADCDDTTTSIYFRDVTNPLYRVYIINRAAYKQYMQNQPTTEQLLDNMYDSDAKKYALEKESLLQYAFVVAPYALNKLSEKINNVIMTTLG